MPSLWLDKNLKHHKGGIVVSETKKKESGKTIKDTYPKMPWEEFLKIVEGCGFKIGYTNEFYSMPSSFVKYEDKEKKEVILYHRGKKLILYAIFSNSEELKSLKLYGEAIEKHEGYKPLMLEGAHFKVIKWHQQFDGMDVTEGLIEKLELINLNYKLCKWTHKFCDLKPFFINCAEEENCQIMPYTIRDEEYDKIIKNKIDAAAFPVSKIISGQ